MKPRLLAAVKIGYHVLTTIAVLVGIAVGYNQLRIWQAEGKSHMDELVRVTLIVVFAACIIGGGLLHFLAARMNRNIKSKSEPSSPSRREPSQIPDPLQLTILGADWGNLQTRVPVADIIERMPRNAVGFFVNPDAFRFYDPRRADPAHGDPGKYIEVKYSYGGLGPFMARRNQGEWIILPEDRQFIERTAAEYERKRLSDLKEAEDRYMKMSEGTRHENVTLKAKLSIDEEDNLKDIDHGSFHRVRNHYMSLKWPERLALKLIYSSTGKALRVSDLLRALENHGYHDDPRGNIVRPLFEASILLESNRHGEINMVLNTADTELSIKSSDIARILARLFKENPLC